MTRIATIALAAALSTLALSAAQAYTKNGGGVGAGGLNGTSINGLDSANGFGNNGVNTTNGIILNGLSSYNGWTNGVIGTNGLDGVNGLDRNGISVSETAGQAILEIRLPDGTVARR